MMIMTRTRLAWLLIALAGVVALAACGGEKPIAVYVTPTPLPPTLTPTVANPTPAAVAMQPTDPAITPLPTPLPPPPGVNFGPITGPQYTPEPLHTALPPTVSVQPCRARVIAPGVQLYAAPEFTAQVVRMTAAREWLPVNQVTRDAAGNQWAGTPEGWLPLDQDGQVFAELAALRACEILRGQEPATTLLGLHVLNGTSHDQVISFVRTMQAAGFPVGTIKGLNGAEQTLADVEAISPQTVTVYRSLLTADGMTDCPADIFDEPDPVMTARRWLAGLEPHWSQVDADYYEFINECPAPMSWLAAFSIEAMKIANEQGRCLLLFSFPGGNPDMQTFNDLLPAYQYALEHPCAPGRTHGIALHAYSMEDTRLVSESDVWVALRHRVLRERLLLTLPEAADLPVYITELGIGGGTLMPGCEMIIRDALQYTYQLEEDPYVKGFHLWSVGTGAQWYDITPCLPDLADALIRYYTFKP